MTLRKATLLLTCLGSLALLLALTLATHFIIDDSFRVMEEDLARKNLERARNAINDEMQRLDETLVDWAVWDDSNRFVQGRAKDFPASNLNDRTIASLHLRAILFLDRAGRVVWGSGFSPEKGAKAPLPEGLMDHLRPGSSLLAGKSSEDRVRGLMLLPQGVMIAAACPILDSNGRGPSTGTLVMLRQLGPQEAAAIAERIRLSLVLESADAPLPADLVPLAQQLSGGMIVDELDDGITAGLMILPDLWGRPALRVVLRDTRDIVGLGSEALARTRLWMAAGAVLFMLALLVFLERRVLSRIDRLKGQVESIGGEGLALGRVDMPGTDELSALARRINETLSELERSRQNLAMQYAATGAQENYLQHILDSIQAGVLLVDPDTRRIVEVNAFAAACARRSREDIVGKLCHGFLCPDAEGKCPATDLGASGEQAVHTLLRSDGSQLAVLKSVSHIERDGRRLWLETFIDVDDLHKTQEALKRSEGVYRTLFMNTGTATMLIEEDTTISLANQEFEKLSGYSREEIEGQRRWTEFFATEDVEWMLRHHLKRRESPDLAPRNYETRFLTRRGEERAALLTVAMIPGSRVSVASIEDITERKAAEEQLRHQAFHDTLTGLPNRLLLQDRLERSVESARREGHQAAVLLMDLDRFKDINDTQGHSVGDRLLMLVARRLETTVRRSDTVARLGGDEFVVVVDGPTNAEAAGFVARHILECFSQPFALDGQSLYVRLSIGLALFPEHGETPETLLKNADLAMYLAKERGRNTYSFFTEELNDLVVRRLAVEASLRRALSAGRVEVHYQPKVSQPGTRISGAEALARCRREDGSLMMPTDFIPVAEETGLIMPLTDMVLRAACQQAAIWRAGASPDFVLAVNLSPRQFLQAGLAQRILTVVQETGLPFTALEFEITENLLLDYRPETLATLNNLLRLGASVVLDDFGKEYSSLGYIKKLPIQVIKIDRSFINDLPDDQDDAAIVQSILSMAATLDLRVVAEGVETAAQLAFLTGLGCREFQGFYFSQPLPVDEMTALLARTDPFDAPPADRNL